MNLAKAIIKKQYHCVFLSPHADDALLSCATLLSQLVGKTPITVINIFIKAHERPYTLSAKQFMKYSNGYSDAEQLYKHRAKEDQKAFAALGIVPQNLNMEDALFRRKKKRSFLGKLLPEFDHVYPTYRWHILSTISVDDYAVSELKKRLTKYNDNKTLIFAPFGLGDHVDHKIVRQVGESLFDNLILYSDFPYNVRSNTYGKASKEYKEHHLPIEQSKKEQLLRLYETQFEGLFPGGKMPKHDEVFFIKTTNQL